MSDLQEALDFLLAFRHGDTQHLTSEHARILYAALAQPQNDAEAVFLGTPDPKAVAARLRGYANEPYRSEVSEVPRSVLFEAAQLLAAPPSPEWMREALPKRPDGIYSKYHVDNWTDADFANHPVATRKTLQYLIGLEEALRAGDNHASDGKVSEINESPLCNKCGHHATSERVLACGNSCQMRPSDDLGAPLERIGTEAAIAQAWQDLLDKDDRTSPEEYPDMALITFDEFRDAILAAAHSNGRIGE